MLPLPWQFIGNRDAFGFGMMLFTVCLILCVLTTGASLAVPPDEPAKAKPAIAADVDSIDGHYLCKGKENDGKSYNGLVTIQKKGELYLVQWHLGVGSNFIGVGIRQGQTLACSWAINSDKGLIRGVNLYRIEAGPKLSGRWASLPGPDRMQTETLTFLRAVDDEDE